MNNDTNVNVKINGEDKSKAAVEQAKSNFSGLWKSVAGGVIASQLAFEALDKVKEGVSTVMDAAKDWQVQQQQLNAAIKSTHDVSGVTKEDADKYAESIEKSTPITRDATLAAENMLLTFTGIHKNVFPQTTQAVADMATRMNGGAIPSLEQMNNTAIMVGKALNDPATGMTKLQRVGVTFTDQQKEQIKTMEKAGNSLGAQKIILAELSKEFGGSAAANAQTFQGRIDMIKNSMVSWGVDGLDKLNGKLNDLTKWWDNSDAANKFKQKLGELKEDSGHLLHEGIEKLRDGLIDLDKWWNAHYEEIKSVAQQIYGFLEPSFKALWDTIENKVFPTLMKLWKQVIEPLLPVVGILFVGAIRLTVDALNALLSVIMPVINWMLSHKQTVIDFAVAFGILAVAMKFDQITSAFMGNMQNIMGSIGGAKNAVVDLFTKVSGGTVMGGIATAGAMADIALVAQAVQSVLGAINAMNQYKDGVKAYAKADSQLIPQLQAALLSSDPKKRSAAQAALNNIKQEQAKAAQMRASGGPVSANNPYIVGEQGMELFIPSTSGKIIPAQKTQQILNNQQSNQNVTIQFTGPVYMTNEQEAQNVGNQLARQLLAARAGSF